MFEGRKPITGKESSGVKVVLDSLRQRTGQELQSAEKVHSAFFEQLRLLHNKKWWSRLLQSFKSTEEVIYEEAVLDNMERDARQSPEFLKWQENLKVVFDEVIRYKNGDRTVRPLLMVLGGAMKGIHCAAQLQAMQELGMKDGFATMIGVSAGSGPMAYFATGETEKSLRLFNEKCTGKEFLDFKRGIGALDTGVIGEQMRKPGDYQLNTETLQQCLADVAVLVTTMDGEVECVDLKTATHNGELDPVAACEQSAAIPIFEPDGKEVNGRVGFDGSAGELPMRTIVDTYKPTSILVLPNLSFLEHALGEMSTAERLVLGIAFMFGKEGSLGSISTEFIRNISKTLLMDNKRSLGQLNEFMTEKEGERAIIDAIAKATGIRIGVMYPPRSRVGNLTNDPITFAAAQIATIEDTRTQLRAIGVLQPAA